MPLIAAPNRGYADYQRTENYDEGVAWSVATAATIAVTTSPLMDMSRFGYLGGYMKNSISNQPCTVTITWFADAGATISVASRVFTLIGNIPGLAQMRLPNLGPFCQIVVTNLLGQTYNLQAVIFGTNRVHPLEFVPSVPQLIPGGSASVGANSQVIVYPNDYYSGPIRVVTNSFGVTGPSVQVMSISPNGSDSEVDSFSNIAVTVGFLTVVPPGAWFIQLTNNQGVAGNMFIAVTGSTTGSI